MQVAYVYGRNNNNSKAPSGAINSKLNTYILMTESGILEEAVDNLSPSETVLIMTLANRLIELDFYYQYSDDSCVYGREELKNIKILSMIKGIKDSSTQELAKKLYDFHVDKHDGALGVDWDSMLEN